MIVEIPVFVSNRVEQVPVELQIRTIAQDSWASHEHNNWYQRAVPARLLAELTEAADAAHRLDMTMQRLHHEVTRCWAASDGDDVELNSPQPTAIEGWRPHAGQLV